MGKFEMLSTTCARKCEQRGARQFSSLDDPLYLPCSDTGTGSRVGRQLSGMSVCLGRQDVFVSLLAATFASMGMPMIPADAAGLSSVQVASKLSRVPVFAITNQQSQPYLTEVDNAGRRSGFFYLGPRDALQVLQQVREFDPS